MGGSAGKTQIAVNTGTVGAGDSIAAYLADGSGNFLSSQVIQTVRRLDVNSASEWAGDSSYAVGDYGSDLFAVRQDVAGTIATADGKRAPLQLDAAGALRVTGLVSVAFTAEHNEDDAAASGDSGISTLLVRQDSLAISTSADGDYGNFKSTNKGELYTHDTDSLAQLVTANTNLGTINTSLGTINTSLGTINTSLAAQTKAEDAPASSGDLLTPAGTVRRDTTGSQTSANGDYAELQSWSNGELKTADIVNLANLQQVVTVGVVAVALPGTSLVNRKLVFLQHVTDGTVHLGTSTVTADTTTTGGFQLGKGGYVTVEAGPADVLYGIGSAAARKVVVWEHS